MPPLSLDQFLELLRRSKLIDASQIDQALNDYQERHAGDSSNDWEPFAAELASRGLLTNWQLAKLRNGRFRGFFLGRYKLLDEIGAGGMSRVLLAEHTMLHQRRAIKVLPRERVGDSTYLARFQLEAQAIAALDHPNIVRAYDIDECNGTHYIVMEYVRGRDLQSMVLADGPLDFKTAADYVLQAARGLEHAHRAGLIHRDVKPANLLVDEDGVVKILDLGLALFHETGEGSLTIAHNENVLGTADYLAPEQALNSHTIDGRADIYGLGCTLYFALTGAPPFPDGTIAQRIARHQSVAPAPLRNHRPDCPESLDIICAGMMRKRPDEPYQDAAAVATALEQFLADRPITSLPPVVTRSEVVASVRREGSSTSDDTPRRRPDFLPRRPQLPDPIDTVAERDADTRKGLPVVTPKDPARHRNRRPTRRKRLKNARWTRWMLFGVSSLLLAMVITCIAMILWWW